MNLVQMKSPQHLVTDALIVTMSYFQKSKPISRALNKTKSVNFEETMCIAKETHGPARNGFSQENSFKLMYFVKS